jgi:hypothetical protein
MLGQHLVDIDVGADRLVLLQIADIDRLRAGNVVDEPEIGAGDELGRVADDRIFADAALEEALAASGRMISPRRSTRAVSDPPWPRPSSVTWVMTPMTCERPVSIARNLPTVTRSSGPASAGSGWRRRVACEPPTDATEPSTGLAGLVRAGSMSVSAFTVKVSGLPG